MKLNRSIIALALILVTGTLAFTQKSQPVTSVATQEREVFTGQRLVTVKINPQNNKDSVNFVAKLRDVFTVISYDEKRSSTLLDWTVCPDGKCPEAKIYHPGTLEYEQLDSLVVQQLANIKIK